MVDTLTPWTDKRKPSPGDNALRDDGRICRVKGYVKLMAVSPTSSGVTPRMGPLGAAELPPTQAGILLDYPPVLMECGEKVGPIIISMCVFWPSVASDPVTCPKCEKAINEAKNQSSRSAPVRLGGR